MEQNCLKQLKEITVSIVIESWLRSFLMRIRVTPGFSNTMPMVITKSLLIPVINQR